MTDEELRQLIASNARAVQANSESISRLEATVEGLAAQSQQTDRNLDRCQPKSTKALGYCIG
ncbi:MAG: hypothetical protein HC812_11610, partial [Leptolyngbya sp. RL_3_1]|nr:hypothetical protein [Leptolyngbya sp. RL_3_1]